MTTMIVFLISFLFCLLTTLLADAGASGERSESPRAVEVVVQTTEGLVAGRINGSEPTRNCLGVASVPGLPDVASFFGVPYAAAPIGELRWRPPRPAPQRAATFDAIRPGAVCPQAPLDQLAAFLPQWTPGWSFEEDCLSLNIWSPSLAADGTAARLAPVVVFIHGGGFAGGNGYTNAGCPFYNGMPIAAKEHLVVVTLNYRVGVLGFLHLPELLAEEGTSGNYGLQDQRLALQWVQRNIRAFGGDPRRVTIMGESAGAASVLYHTALPRSAGLYAQAIAQSGYDATRQPASQGSWVGPQIGPALLRDLGCERGPAEADLACLRKATTRQVLTAQDKILNARPLSDSMLMFGPTADGFEMPVGSSLVAEMRRHPPRVPLLLGSNLNETSLFLCESLKEHMSTGDAVNRTCHFASMVGINFTAREAEQALSRYPVGPGAGTYPSQRGAVIGLTTDLVFSCTTQVAADTFSSVPKASVYRYLLARSPRLFRLAGSCLGVPHAVDTFYMFMVPSLPDGLVSSALFDKEDRALADSMASAWWSFVRSGSPALPGDTAQPWPRYESSGKAMLRLDANTSAGHGFHARECAALRGDSPLHAAESSSLLVV